MTTGPAPTGADVATVRPVPERSRVRFVSGIALAVVVVTGAVGAVLLHRNGHTQGDDFALYLRQARSLFDGDVAQVVADNRFAVLNSGFAFSPVAYPWGFPLLLAPFVRLWSLDYDRLKLVVVAAFCVWMVLVHGIVRRRIGRVAALAVVAVFASAPLYLAHTDQLLSEFPHAMAVAVFVWWLDRARRRAAWTSPAVVDALVLGALAAVAFNVRRESSLLVGAIAVAQLVDVIALLAATPTARWRRAMRWSTLLVPYLGFAVTAILAQLLLPSTLLPDNNGGAEFIGPRLGDYMGALTAQLGLGRHPAVGIAIVVVAFVGVVIGCIRRPALDAPLAAVMVLSAIGVSTHFRMVDRYYFQVTPWVLYFALAAVLAFADAIVGATGAWPRGAPRRRALRVAHVVAVVPFAVLVASHVAVLRGDIADARDFDRAGGVQIGPAHPDYVPIYDAVTDYTGPDDVVAFFRARTMTLLTDRRSFQTTSFDHVLQRADWFAQRKGSDYSQPDTDRATAIAAGLIPVWEDEHWILWHVDRGAVPVEPGP